MDTPDMVKLDEADFGSLKQFAQVNLGLEVKPGTNGASLRGAIQKADASVTEIPMFVPTGEGTPRATPPEKGTIETAVKDAVTANGSDVTEAVGSRNHSDPLHFSHDPKVTIYIPKTDDKRRARDVSVNVNGILFRLRRAVEVAVPYRVYEALMNGTEKSAVDSDEINPATGEPLKVWEDVQSYPMQVRAMPTDEEVAEWREKTSGKFQKAA